MLQPAHPLEPYNQAEAILLCDYRIKQECAVTVGSLSHCLPVDVHLVQT